MDEKTTKTVGIDIGGTSIKMGLVTERGEVLATSKVSTGALNSDGAFAKVCEGVHALAEQGGIDASELDAIGLDVPGVVLEDGTLTMAPTSRSTLPDSRRRSARRTHRPASPS